VKKSRCGSGPYKRPRPTTWVALTNTSQKLVFPRLCRGRACLTLCDRQPNGRLFAYVLRVLQKCKAIATRTPPGMLARKNHRASGITISVRIIITVPQSSPTQPSTGILSILIPGCILIARSSLARSALDWGSASSRLVPAERRAAVALRGGTPRSLRDKALESHATPHSMFDTARPPQVPESAFLRFQTPEAATPNF